MGNENTTKVCFKCDKEQSLDEFYIHKQMGDGHLNKCKECTKHDVALYREKNIERIRKYDRDRGNMPHRIKINTERMREYRQLFPEKYKAKCILNNAKRSGKIQVSPCVVCGTTDRMEAHHYDYRKPLDVIWLCSVHHHAVHHNGLKVDTPSKDNT